MKITKWWKKLKNWQKGIITGIFLGLILPLFLFALMFIGERLKLSALIEFPFAILLLGYNFIGEIIATAINFFLNTHIRATSSSQTHDYILSIIIAGSTYLIVSTVVGKLFDLLKERRK
ncbi:hypothetical protein HYY73_06345 [Candidatus Woesearchaeota archaeon]|nr:hypothetical protein [Candidatus Woesearchaeota archaeon]